MSDLDRYRVVQLPSIADEIDLIDRRTMREGRDTWRSTDQGRLLVQHQLNDPKPERRPWQRRG